MWSPSHNAGKSKKTYSVCARLIWKAKWNLSLPHSWEKLLKLGYRVMMNTYMKENNKERWMCHWSLTGTSRTVRRKQRHLLSTPVNILRLKYIMVIGPFCDYPITNIQILSNIVSVRVYVRVSGVFTGEPDEKYKQWLPLSPLLISLYSARLDSLHPEL